MSPMKIKHFSAKLLCLALAALILAGCGAPAVSPIETTEATEPAPTTPADGNPNDVTCLGTYYVSDEAISNAKNTVVAEIGDVKLTNSQLQMYYWLAVADYRQEDNAIEPDFSQSLDLQECPLDTSVGSWQQYFLREALNTWHTRQALVLLGEQEGLPKEEEYQPDLEKHQEYMLDKPAYKYHQAHYDSFQPNDLHQAYLDSIPEMLETLAADNGFTNNDAQVAAIAGAGAASSDLESFAHTSNLAYMYFTEMGYFFEPAAEEVEAYYQSHKSEIAANGEKNVDIRHILLIPQDAEIAPDGTVTATEEAWNVCLTQANALVDKWKDAVKKTRFAQFVIYDIAEARFSEFAKDHSADEGSRANGGLYVDLSKGQLTDALDRWCFDEVRQHGDYEIIRSDFGYHIVFFSGSTEDWYAAAEAALILQMGQDLVEKAKTANPITIHYSEIKLGQPQDNGSFVTTSSLLYPDVAHERYPKMPLYMQQDYPNAPYGDYKLSSHGCGITTLAMVASYLADDFLSPVELAANYGYYCGIRGTEICLLDNTPAEMGFYLDRRAFSWSEIKAAIDNGQIVVALQYAGYWTSGGHYIAITEPGNAENMYVVRDSNLLNYKRITAHLEDQHTRGSITQAAQYFWIYEPKVTRIPACVRCSEDLTAGVPSGLFQADYHCAKCNAAMSRRDTFLETLSK